MKMMMMMKYAKQIVAVANELKRNIHEEDWLHAGINIQDLEYLLDLCRTQIAADGDFYD